MTEGSRSKARLAGKVALVTGGSSGIGRATSLRLAREGAHVVIADVEERSREGGVPTAEAIIANGGHATHVRADVTATAEVEHLVSISQSITGRLDIVVNNAGRFSRSPLLDTSDDSWDADMAINVRSQFLMCRSAISLMIKQEPIGEVRGRIINVTSQLGITAPPEAVTYAVAKAGVAHLTRQLAVDFAADGIIVNAVAPGRIITGYHPGEAEYVADGSVDDATDFSLRRTPFPRLGRPDDVAGAILFLSSDDCTFVSGHVLMVDGGWTAF